MHKTPLIPIGMGLGMGLIMMWMLHGSLTGQSTMAGWAFVLAHFAAIGVAALLAALGIWRNAAIVTRLLAHRPSWRHLALILAVAAAIALTIHLLHGGP